MIFAIVTQIFYKSAVLLKIIGIWVIIDIP